MLNLNPKIFLIKILLSHINLSFRTTCTSTIVIRNFYAKTVLLVYTKYLIVLQIAIV